MDYIKIISLLVIFCSFFARIFALKRLLLNGTEVVNENEFPFTVYLYSTRYDYNIFCSGAIITNTWILTTAQCITISEGRKGIIKRSSDFYIGAGELDATRERNSNQIRLAKQLVVHELYNPKLMLNDIALIKVNDPFFTEYSSVNPVSISSRMSLGYLPASQIFNICTIIMWPAVEKSASNSLLLRKLEVQVETCNNISEYINDSTHICVYDFKYNNTECSILGGAQLICDDFYPRLYGIMNHRNRYCDDEGEPFIFTKVSAFEDWINKNFLADNTSFAKSYINSFSIKMKNEFLLTCIALYFVFIIKLMKL